MPQIDVVLRFASLTVAKADPVVQKYRNQIEDLWADDSVIPNIKVWRVSQDVIGTDAEGKPTVTHTYVTGWLALISLPRVVTALHDHPAVQFVVDRDKMNARQPGMILRKTITDAALNDFRFEPVFAGMDPPWGAWQ